MPPSQQTTRRPESGLGAGLLRAFVFFAFVYVAYLSVANWRLHARLRELSPEGLRVTWSTAYTIVPGRIELTGMELSHVRFRLDADVVHLRLGLSDFFKGRPRIESARFDGVVVEVAADAPAGDRASVHRAADGPPAVMHASALGSSEPSAPAFGLHVRALTASVRRLSTPGVLVSGRLHAEGRDLSLQGGTLDVGASILRLRDASVTWDGHPLARAIDGNVRVSDALVPADGRPSGSLSLRGTLSPAAPTGVRSGGPIQANGHVTRAHGESDVRGALVLETDRRVTVALATRRASLPDGFEVTVRTPENGSATLDATAPGLRVAPNAATAFRLEDARLHIEPAVGSGNDRGQFAANLEADQVDVTVSGRTFRSRMQGTVQLRKDQDDWTIGPGHITLPRLSTGNVNGSVSATAALHHAVSLASPLPLDGSVDLSGAKLGTLLAIARAPESLELMLSRSLDHPFDSTAEMRVERGRLCARDVALDSGRLHVRGAACTEEKGAPRGALLVERPGAALGIRFGGAGLSTSFGADRAWLRDRTRGLFSRND